MLFVAHFAILNGIILNPEQTMAFGLRKSFGRKAQPSEPSEPAQAAPPPGAPASQANPAQQANLAPMQKKDLKAVLAIIDAHDDDDAEAAEQSYKQQGIKGQFVYRIEGRIAGVTGYRPIAGSDRSCWLSWTYLEKSLCGQGHGRRMMDALLPELKRLNVRKVFVAVSDYVDPEDGPIYAAALALYKSLGFTMELTLPDYYDEGEAEMILGRRLRPRKEGVDIQEENDPIRFHQVDEIAETDGAYVFGWEVGGDKHFTAADLDIGVQAVRNKPGARSVYVSFPSNLPMIHAPLREAGFENIGRLVDYYEDGVDELHFVYYL